MLPERRSLAEKVNNEQGVGSAKRQLRCSGNGFRDLGPAYVVPRSLRFGEGELYGFELCFQGHLVCLSVDVQRACLIVTVDGLAIV